MPGPAQVSPEVELRPVWQGRLHPARPFDLLATVMKPSHFPSRNTQLAEGTWYQALSFGGLPLGVTLRAAGSVEQPVVDMTVHAARDPGQSLIAGLCDEVLYRYDMASDLGPFYQRFENDPLLGPVLRRRRGMRVSTSASLYEFLITTVVLQNATVRRTVQMMDNLITHYGHAVVFAGKQMGALGDPGVMGHASEEDLRALKLGYRAKTIRRLTDAFTSGSINEGELRALDTETLRKRLLALYGIGPASVWYLLFEVFHRYDAFHHISPWEQKIFSRLLFGEALVPAGRILEFAGHNWAGWRMLAAHYLFEDLFWQRREGSTPDWLEELIRL